MKTTTKAKASQGSALLEVLITIVILAIGLLGIAGLQARIYALELESYQRAQAVTILNDIAERIQSNPDTADSFVAAGTLGGGGSLADCTSLADAARDVCELGNQLKGAGEKQGSNAIGAMVSARACITDYTDTISKSFERCQAGVQIVVAWQGRSRTIVPAATCGSSIDAKWRAISTRVGTKDVTC